MCPLVATAIAQVRRDTWGRKWRTRFAPVVARWRKGAQVADICLVACASAKVPHPAAAKDLYASALFKKSRAYAERAFDAWYVLSAKHGLVLPESVLEPYNVTLNSLGVTARRAWADWVFAELRARVGAGDRVTFLAGMRYREFLEGPLRAMGVDVQVPLEGLRIGEQLAQLSEMLEGAS
jgi:hypothetical protein